MKNLKKILAVVLAVVLMAALSVTMFAVNSDATKNTTGGIETNDNIISIKKDILFINAEDTTVRQPNITYTYTLTAAEGGATVTDANGITGTVKAGVAAAIKTGTATIALADTATAPASSAGTALTNYAQFEFQPTGFEAPGIYRYKISETTNVTKASVGIVEASGYVADRYLDVYVSRTSDTDSTLIIYGYVLYEGEKTTNFDGTTNATVNLDKKSAGFVNTGSAANLADVDSYTTQNLYINKVTTGKLADKNNDFPIAATLTVPQAVTATIKYDVTTSNNGVVNNTTTDTVGAYVTGSAINGTVRNGSQIAIKGIPTGATVSIVETNNTVDSYKVKAGKTAGADDLLAEKIVNPKTAAGAVNVTLDTKSEVHFTNTLETISPTGVMIRFAPFAIILLAGVALFVIARRRRVED